MVELLDVVFVLGGAVFLFAGAVLSIYGVALLGAVVGAGGGYILAPTIAGPIGVEGALATAVAVPVGALVGVLITYVLLSMAVAAISFVVGTYFGMVVVAPAVSSGLAQFGVAIGVGVAAAVIGSLFTKTMMIIITSAVGAALVSLQVTFSDLETAQSDLVLDPILFDIQSPIFIGLFVLGVLSQFGLFKLGWVTKIVAKLPGARALTDRGEEDAVEG
jgi:hypothetical protein